MQKNALIVFGHPNLKSFCAAFRDLTTQKLSAKGYNIEHSDLYQMEFNPILSIEDFKAGHSASKPAHMREHEHGFDRNSVDPRILREIDKIDRANYLWFVAPMWMGGFPAIMKGWLDRVLIRGFAVDIPHNMFDKAYLKGKKCAIVTTTGNPKEFFQKEGPGASGLTLEEHYWSVIHSCFAFSGMETLPMFAAFGMDNATAESRKQRLKDYEEYLDSFENMKPISCPLLHFK